MRFVSVRKVSAALVSGRVGRCPVPARASQTLSPWTLRGDRRRKVERRGQCSPPRPILHRHRSAPAYAGPNATHLLQWVVAMNFPDTDRESVISVQICAALQINLAAIFTSAAAEILFSVVLFYALFNEPF